MFEYKLIVLDCYEKPETHSETLSQMGKEGWLLVAILPGINEEEECALANCIFSRFVPLELPVIPPVEEIIYTSPETPEVTEAEVIPVPTSIPEDPLTVQRKKELRVYWNRCLDSLTPKEIADLLEAIQRAEWEMLVQEITPRLIAHKGDTNVLPYFNLHGLRQIHREFLQMEAKEQLAA